MTNTTYKTMDTCADQEVQSAYEYAFEHGITTMSTCVRARTSDYLTRGQTAKMMVNFATTVL